MYIDLPNCRKYIVSVIEDGETVDI